jgi:Acyl-CoA carboxylase epsilon subunit
VIERSEGTTIGTVHELRILAGRPTEEELAAVTVVLLAASRATAGTDEPAPVSRWRTSARPTVPGRAAPGAWRASALPVR